MRAEWPHSDPAGPAPCLQSWCFLLTATPLLVPTVSTTPDQGSPGGGRGVQFAISLRNSKFMWHLFYARPYVVAMVHRHRTQSGSRSTQSRIKRDGGRPDDSRLRIEGLSQCKSQPLSFAFGVDSKAGEGAGEAESGQRCRSL